jgi:3-hydroxy-9,10-secoandrosta-1,3,5(10)-triene-9,17-dione monooxygenase reductase component
MPVSKDLFRKVLGHFATGVTVVTTRHETGEPWGFTVNAFTSVSLEPPLILVCVDQGTESHRAMAGAKYFAVNFLTDKQQDISKHFASRSPDRFSAVAHSDSVHGSPLIAGCLGFLECEKVASHIHGDHTVMIGEVIDASVTGGDPLIFYSSSYGRLAPPPDSTPH